MISRSFYLRKPIPCILGFGLLFLSACTQKAFDKSAPKTMQLSLPDEVKSADPASSNDTVSAELIGHIFEGLLQFSYSGVLGSLDPALAEAMPVLSDNNTTIKFKLKSGIFFQDDPAFLNGKGRNVSSDDFIYSFKRIADPASGSTNWWMFDGLVDGFNEWRSALEKASSSEKKTYFDKPVVGLTAEGPLALTIHLKRAYPQLLYILAMQPTAVVAREVVEKYGPEVQNHPVGTGPFRLKSWVRSSEIVVEKNPGYRTVYFPGSQDRLPFVQEIHWHILKEEQPMWLKFRKGELDITGIPKDNFAEAIGADGKVKADLAKQGVL